jgi:hypothetical protein
MKFLLLITVLIFFSQPADCSQAKAEVKSIFRSDTEYQLGLGGGNPPVYCSPEIVRVGHLTFLRVVDQEKPLLINLNSVNTIRELRSPCRTD